MRLPDGRPRTSETQNREITVTGTRVRRDDARPVTAAQITPEDLQRLGLVTPADMIAQLPSNVGTSELERGGDGAEYSIAVPRGLAFVDGTPAGETDASGSFQVELPRGGTYVITAKIESPDSRGYGYRQPVAIVTGQTLQLSAPIILSVTTSRACCSARLPAQ